MDNITFEELVRLYQTDRPVWVSIKEWYLIHKEDGTIRNHYKLVDIIDTVAYLVEYRDDIPKKLIYLTEVDWNLLTINLL